MKGKVYLVGAGPGDPELLTLKAVRILKSADVVLYDELVGPEVLACVPRTAFLHNVGKRCGRKSIRQGEINALLVSFASSGLQVVRLKGGDPMVFGRGGEEIEALRQAKVEFEIVPGVTAVLGAAASTQIPLTHRGISSALVFLPGHHADSARPEEWRALLSSKATLVIYMPGYGYEATSQKLLVAGLSGDTPCAIVSKATSPDEQVYRTTVDDLPSVPQLPAPTLLIVGEVVQLADHAAAKVGLGQEVQSAASLLAVPIAAALSSQQNNPHTNQEPSA
jgi:uroporphyrin-III C-methyltransferase